MKKDAQGEYIGFLKNSSILGNSLGYKPEDRGFENRLSEILTLPNISGRLLSL
jgi:hypothetical protein